MRCACREAIGLGGTFLKTGFEGGIGLVIVEMNAEVFRVGSLGLLGRVQCRDYEALCEHAGLESVVGKVSRKTQEAEFLEMRRNCFRAEHNDIYSSLANLPSRYRSIEKCYEGLTSSLLDMLEFYTVFL